MHILKTSNRINRRKFLRGAGVAMALPFLEAMMPPFTQRLLGATPVEKSPRRMLAICNNLGVLPDSFSPTRAVATIHSLLTYRKSLPTALNSQC